MVGLLKVIEGRIKKLDCSLYWTIHCYSELECVVVAIQEFANKDYVLPSIINIFNDFGITATNNDILDSPWVTPELFTFRSTSAFNLSSFEINLYDTDTIPMNIFPLVPVRKYKFGAAEAKPTLIRLGDHGIVDLKDEIFHLSEYIDDHGMVSHAVTLNHGDYQSLIEERHLLLIYIQSPTLIYLMKMLILITCSNLLLSVLIFSNFI